VRDTPAFETERLALRPLSGGELFGYCGLLHLGVTERVELLYALLPAW
jgi:hypothetical protein